MTGLFTETQAQFDQKMTTRIQHTRPSSHQTTECLDGVKT